MEGAAVVLLLVVSFAVGLALVLGGGGNPSSAQELARIGRETRARMARAEQSARRSLQELTKKG